MWGNDVPDRFETDAEYVANAGRTGWERGAEIRESPYTGDRDSFESIVENAPVPTYLNQSSRPEPPHV
jgi:DhnA family fructose-bisphosphate aldolase class Ia